MQHLHGGHFPLSAFHLESQHIPVFSYQVETLLTVNVASAATAAMLSLFGGQLNTMHLMKVFIFTHQLVFFHYN